MKTPRDVIFVLEKKKRRILLKRSESIKLADSFGREINFVPQSRGF